MSRHSCFRLALWTAASLLLLIAWDLLALDLTLARWFGNASGFPLRDHWLASRVLHSGARRVAWALQLALVLSIWWPLGPLRVLSRRERIALVATILVSILVIFLLKNRSATSCPWELAEFGGTARYVSHWSWGVADGGEGRCFPAGHASVAFCFIGGYFWLREKAPRAAVAWLAVTLLAGLVVGISQQVRGAHYMSHTLWTAWMCWVAAGLMFLLLKPSQKFGTA